jgi:ADP-ribosylglycohydrolase
VEFWDLARIQAQVGEDGVRDYLPVSTPAGAKVGQVTDDTQMTLFTAEGMIRASVRAACKGLGFTVGVLHHAYDRWLDTQLLEGPDGERDGWLIEERWLYAQRAPGTTCLSALTEARAGGRRITSFGTPARNDSKGCGGVMRSAPVGLLPPWDRAADEAWVFDVAAESAGFTHGHPTGQAASGALAVLIAALVRGEPLTRAVDTALAVLRSRPSGHETAPKLELALRWAAEGRRATPALMEQLVEGWVAEEALAMAVYAALTHPGPDQVLDALGAAVTHSGDSDSTGAIAGNILGALHGDTALPAELVFKVEGRGTILQLADDFVYEFTEGHRLRGDYGPHTGWLGRYPGS